MTKNPVILVLVLLLLLGSGCRHRRVPAPAQNVIILLPNDDGSSSGSLVVSNAYGSQQLTDAYSEVKVIGATAAPNAPVKVDAAEVQHLFGQTLALLPPAEARFTLFFDTGGTVLTPEAQAELPRIVETVRQRKSTDVTIIGHTDTVGDRQTNYELGLKRAEEISRTIRALGVNPSDIFVESHGENDLLVPTADNVDEPRNRRVEVIVR